MRILIAALFVFWSPLEAAAVDVLNGRLINKRCALCHGTFGQGAPGPNSPRIAGLPKDYMIDLLNDFVSGKRVSVAMVMAAGLDQLTEQDIHDVAAFLAEIDLRNDPRFVIPVPPGDVEAGKDLFMGECRRGCHQRDGYGKPSKGVPPLTGQHSDYLVHAIKGFQVRQRVHDNDPGDPTFDDLSDQEIADLVAFVATLDTPTTPRFAELPQIDLQEVMTPTTRTAILIDDVIQTVARIPLQWGVSRDDAITAMNDRAAQLDMDLVRRQDISDDLAARGIAAPYVAIFQYCDVFESSEIVANNLVFAAYMPCRIALVEDAEGRDWLVMMNLDMLVNNRLVEGLGAQSVIRVNQRMLDIMIAGATGERP